MVCEGGCEGARGETMPKPRKDEVVLFREFFSTRLRSIPGELDCS